MKTSVKNNQTFKTFVVALTIVLAIGFSAFKNAPKQENRVDTYLVQDSPGHWIETNTEPDLSNCATTQTRQCYYKVNDESILTEDQDEFNATQIDAFMGASPAKIQNGLNSSAALYVE